MITYNQDKSITIAGFNEGIADDPYSGFQDIRGCDIDTYPGAIRTNSALKDINTISQVKTFTVNTSTELCTSTLTGDLDGIPVKFTTSNQLPVSIPQINTTDSYWITAGSGSNFTTFYVWDRHPSLSGAVQINFTGTGVGTQTITTHPPTYFRHIVDGYAGEVYGLDSTGRLWDLTNGIDCYTDGNTKTNGNGSGLVYYKGWILVFRSRYIDAYPRAGSYWAGTWKNDWIDMSSGSHSNHKAIVGQDDVVYYINFNLNNASLPELPYIGSIREKPGKIFDPNDNTTYTESPNSLDLPNFNGSSQSNILDICEYGKNLAISMKNNIYLWDRISPSFNMPIGVGTNGNLMAIINYNNEIYCFAQEGLGLKYLSIYKTNGTSSGLVKRFPRNLSTVSTAQALVGNGSLILYRDKLMFLLNQNYNTGLWSYNFNNDRLVMENGVATNGATFYNRDTYPFSSVGGLYFSNNLVFVSYFISSSSMPLNVFTGYNYSTFSSYFITPFIQTQDTKRRLEIYFDRDIVTSDGVRVLYRNSLEGTFTPTIDNATTLGLTEANYVSTFANKMMVFELDNSQNLLQLKVVMSSDRNEVNNTYSTSPTITKLVLI